MKNLGFLFLLCATFSTYATVVIDESTTNQGAVYNNDERRLNATKDKSHSQTIIVVTPTATESPTTDAAKSANPEAGRLRSIQNSKRQSIRYSEKE